MAFALRHSRRRNLLQEIPPVLRPAFRAYILGYASSTTPRLLTLFLTYIGRKRKSVNDQQETQYILSILGILKGGLEFQRFPTFCAALVGGYTALEVSLPVNVTGSDLRYVQLPIKEIIRRIAANLSITIQLRYVHSFMLLTTDPKHVLTALGYQNGSQPSLQAGSA